jgi:hypothetical protein
VSQAPRRKAPNRSRSRRPANEAEFWGDAGVDVEVDDIQPAADPAAMVASLGPAPLPGRETIAEHYFKAIYDRAAALAVAVAASSDLLPPPDDDG